MSKASGDCAGGGQNDKWNSRLPDSDFTESVDSTVFSFFECVRRGSFDGGAISLIGRIFIKLTET